MYEEDFRYSERYTEQKRAESSQFRRNFAESSESERNKLSELVGKKRSFNENRFKRKEQPIADRDNKYLRSDPIKHREVDSIKSESRQSQDIHFNSRTILITTLIILMGVNWWLSKSVARLYAEKVELQQEIEKTPTERKILARIDYQEDKGMIYIKTKKPAEASEDSEGLIILKMKSDKTMDERRVIRAWID